MTEWQHSISLKERTVCVVTPVPLTSDSRTLKQICSLQRAGAVVVAVAGGERATEGTPASSSSPKPPSEPSSLARVWRWVRTTRQPALVVAPFFLAWLTIFLWQSLRVASKLPSASLFVLHGISVYPAYVLSRRKATFVYDIHDFYCGVEPSSELGTFERVFHRPFLHFLERRCMAKAAAAVTVSNGLAGLIEDAYGRRPAVIRNCHDSRLDTEIAKDVRAALGLDGQDFLIVVVGNHKLGQRFDAFFAALGQLPSSVHVALIGRGYEALAPQIEAAGLARRVHIVGASPPWSIVPSIRSADAAALPYYGRSDNYRLSLPNGFFQSVGAGLPLLFPDLPEMTALAARHQLGQAVDWSAADDIVKKVAALRNEQRIQGHIGASAAAAEQLSWQLEEQPWLAVLTAAVSGEATRAGPTNCR